ncbi:amidohydrolase, partial [Gemmatimonadota bacterium]
MQNRTASKFLGITSSISALMAVLLVPSVTLAQPGSFDRMIIGAIQSCEETIIAVRHQIHANPELGNREFETAALVAAHLITLGLEVRTGVAHTGPH